MRDSVSPGPAVLDWLGQTVERDIADLRPHLELQAEKSEKEAIAELAENGRREAAAMEKLLQRQIEKVQEQIRSRKPPAAIEQMDLFGASQEEIGKQLEREMRQFEADRRSWPIKLSRLQNDLKNEPEKARRGYEVQARRLEPVGLIYLWPSTN